MACSSDKSMLFILLFDLYNNDSNLKMRMYRIYLYNLYHMKVYLEIKTTLYNNYLVVSLSANKNNPDTNYFSLLMILSYANVTDSIIDISPYLIENINNNGASNQTNFISKLQENIKIENNIFGYELVNEIKLIDFPSSLNFYNIVSGNKILVNKSEILSNNYEIKQLENVIKNSEDIFFIEHQFIVKEPSYEKFNLYPVEIVDYPEGSTADQSSEFEEKKFYSKVNKVSFKLCNEKCENCYYLGTSNNPKCFSCTNNTGVDASGNCLGDNTTECQKYYIEKETNRKICVSMKENCPLNYPFYNETSNECMEKISFVNLLQLNLSIYNLYEEKEIIYNLFVNTVIETYTGNDNLIISTQDSNIFQLTNSLNELNTKDGIISNNKSLSIIDLGDCGAELKRTNNLTEDTTLIIFKLEKAGEVASKRNIQYEVYNPITKIKMNLSVCDDEKIGLYIPVPLSGEKEELNKDLLSYG